MDESDEYILGEDVTWLFKSKRPGAVVTVSVKGLPLVTIGIPNITTTASSAETMRVAA